MDDNVGIPYWLFELLLSAEDKALWDLHVRGETGGILEFDLDTVFSNVCVAAAEARCKMADSGGFVALSLISCVVPISAKRATPFETALLSGVDFAESDPIVESADKM